MEKFSIAYFGTPAFSARFLDKLLMDASIKHLIEVELVVTQPDKPVGRKQIYTPSPVKSMASKLKGLEIENSLRTENLKLKLKKFDLVLVYAYGEMIPKDLLDLPRLGFLNIHPSLLPKYRGASPIAYPLILGDMKTGVTIIRMDEKLDHGPIIAQEEFKIQQEERRTDLEIRVTDVAFEMLKKILITYIPYRMRPHSQWSLQLHPQNHPGATYTRLLKKDDGFIPLSSLQKAVQGRSFLWDELPNVIKDYYLRNNIAKSGQSHQFGNNTQIIFNLFRGLFPWPGLWTLNNIHDKQRRLKITDITLSSKQDNQLTRKLVIKKVQLEGKKEVDFETFQRAYPNVLEGFSERRL